MKTNDLITQLKAYKKVSKLSQIELSSIIGVNKFTMNRWLKGYSEPSVVYRSIIKDFLKNKS